MGLLNNIFGIDNTKNLELEMKKSKEAQEKKKVISDAEYKVCWIYRDIDYNGINGIEIYGYKTDEKSFKILSKEKYRVPETIDEKPVISLFETFMGNVNFTYAPIVPECVKIMTRTFANTNIDIAGNKIPLNAEVFDETFLNCQWLEKVVMYKNVKVFQKTFYGCKSLNNILFKHGYRDMRTNILPDGIKSIDYAFVGTDIKEMAISESILSAKLAFANSKITNVRGVFNINANVTGVFQNCLNLRTCIEIPATSPFVANCEVVSSDLIISENVRIGTGNPLFNCPNLISHTPNNLKLFNASVNTKNGINSIQRALYTKDDEREKDAKSLLLFQVEDYEYALNAKWTGRKWESYPLKGWGVRVIDDQKTSYSKIIERINGLPIVCMSSTFVCCFNLIASPEIPKTVKYANDCFSGCISLNSKPELPEHIVEIKNIFQDTKFGKGVNQ